MGNSHKLTHTQVGRLANHLTFFVCLVAVCGVYAQSAEPRTCALLSLPVATLASSFDSSSSASSYSFSFSYFAQTNAAASAGRQSTPGHYAAVRLASPHKAQITRSNRLRQHARASVQARRSNPRTVSSARSSRSAAVCTAFHSDSSDARQAEGEDPEAAAHLSKILGGHSGLALFNPSSRTRRIFVPACSNTQ